MQQKRHLKLSKIKLNLEKDLGLNIKKDNKYIIPIFIPHRGCKNECVFCNQRKISGEIRDVTVQDVRYEIEKYLKLYKDVSRKKQIAFFGGSFTGLDIKDQLNFLKVANEYISLGLVEDIRISTRPDYIDKKILKLLRENNVKVIELGVQSMDDEVLIASKRGHSSADVRNASKLIKKYGFKLGHQVMVGLPKSDIEKELYTIKECIKLKPEIVRIYPVYVLKDSKLYDMYETGMYVPLSLEQSIERTSKIYSLCIKNGINVIRIGLQTTETINSKNAEIKGPVCDNYKEKVLSYISNHIVLSKIKKINKKDVLEIKVNKNQVNYVVGSKRENVSSYESEFGGKVVIKIK